MIAPLALYIHWPFCKAKCPYCDFNSHVRAAIDHDAWQRALLQELEYMAAHVSERQLVSIFFGGGTPSLMPPEIVMALIEKATSLWSHGDTLEITLEANPTSVEAKNFAALKQAGVNRLSMGIQSLDDRALKFLGREHSAREALAALDIAREQWENISFDLIYALPEQTQQAWKHELAHALSYDTSHLSLYQLTIEPGTNFYHRAQSGSLPVIDEERALLLFEETQRMMADAGLPAYEISNHAKPAHACRHNLAYWRLEDYVGIGPGAHGRFQASADTRRATCTIKSPEKWLEAVQQQGHGYVEWSDYPTTQGAEELLLMNLRLTEGMAWARLNQFDATASEFIKQSATYQHYVEDGWLHDDGVQLAVTDKGRRLLNHIIGELAGSLHR